MSVESYAEVAALLSDPTLVVSGDGLILSANGAVEDRLGVDRSRLAGAFLCDVVADRREDVDAYLRACTRSRQRVIGALAVLCDDGRPEPCRAEGATLRPRSGGDPALVLLRLLKKEEASGRFVALNRRIDDLNREILRRKRVEEDLRAQREWLEVTLTSIGDAVVTTDVEGNVSFLNPVAERLTGWTQREAAGRPLRDVFHIVNEITREEVESPVAKVLREGTVVGLANHTVLIAKDGAENAIEDTAAPIKEPGGELQGVVLVFHDVGDRRVLERELHARAERLAENDRRKDEFLAMLAHELRNPLASISNAVQLFDQPGAERDLPWVMEVIGRQAAHLARLVDDLLDASRVTSGKIRLRTEPLDLAPVVSSAVDAVRPLVEERKHRLEVSLAPGTLRLHADPLRLEQVLVNLLANAAKYTEAGGRITLAGRRDGGEILITVADTGVGIPPEQLPRMFELFAQGSRSIARSEGGLGIGLTLVKALVELHGGAVSASSDGPGRGTTFTVRLPATEDDVEAPAPAGPPAASRRRVLVVDDNRPTATLLGKLLTLQGHDVAVAYDGFEAVERARTHRPEVVLLDIGLPGRDGYEVARMLRREACCEGALIVAVSGYGQEEDRRRSREAGFDHHLVKPVDMAALTTLIAAAAPPG